MSTPKTPTSTHLIAIGILFTLVFLVIKYSNNESKPPIDNTYKVPPQEINYDNVEYIAPDTTKAPIVDGHTTDELFEVYHYIYSKGTVIKAETNVLFTDGKNDELQVTVDMPNGQTFEYYLKDKVDLGKVNGLDSYLYTSDEGDKINVCFKNGREMMGFVAGKQNFVFMNTPNYKE